MMIHAYGEDRLRFITRNLGVMFDYAVYEANTDIDEFADLFAGSTVAWGLETAHPRYLTGMSAMEIYEEVVSE